MKLFVPKSVYDAGIKHGFDMSNYVITLPIPIPKKPPKKKTEHFWRRIL